MSVFEEIINIIKEAAGPDYDTIRVDKAEELINLYAEQYRGGWRSVDEELPTKEGSYLVVGKTGGATVTRWYGPSQFHPEGHFGGNSADYIRYWMPRPIAPGNSKTEVENREEKIGMRKCEGSYMWLNPDTRKYEEVKFELGYFHQFSVNFEEFESGPGIYAIAIVELPDGRVVTPEAQNIRFIDTYPPKKVERPRR